MIMDIKLKLRQALLEGKHSHKNEYGCVMVYLNADKDKWGSMLDLIDKDDLYEPKDDPSYGKETNPHVTILFGLHKEVADKDIEEEINKIKTPDIKFGGISAFKNEKFEVLKFDVDSKDMHKLNKNFREFPHTNTYPDYHPHCTIAYLKPKMADKYIKKLNDSIEMEMTPNNIVYSKVDGSKKTYNLK
jgi:2'-5' RNA ligase